MSGRRTFLTRAAAALAGMVGAGAVGRLPSNHVLASTGSAITSRLGSDAWVGEIVTVPFNFAPRGFAFCEGQEMNIQQNQSLYALLGTNFGGDGRSTFRLPDTRALEASIKKQARAQRPPFRYVIAVAGVFPSRA